MKDDEEVDLIRNKHNIPVPREPKKPFRVDDIVRIAITRRLFRKAYICQWSEVLFVSEERLPAIPTMYRVNDLVDETFTIRNSN